MIWLSDRLPLPLGLGQFAPRPGRCSLRSIENRQRHAKCRAELVPGVLPLVASRMPRKRNQFKRESRSRSAAAPSQWSAASASGRLAIASAVSSFGIEIGPHRGRRLVEHAAACGPGRCPAGFAAAPRPA